MKKALFGISIILIILSFLRCEDVLLSRQTIYVANQTDRAIEAFVLGPNKVEIVLPENEPNLVGIDANSSWLIVDTTDSLEEYFSQFEANTIHVFVIDRDTLNTYSWTTIREDNNFLARYDVQLADLVTLNNVKTIIHSDE